jgi:hypothetical protein
VRRIVRFFGVLLGIVFGAFVVLLVLIAFYGLPVLGPRVGGLGDEYWANRLTMTTSTYVADLSKCLEVPEPIQVEIRDKFLIGEAQTHDDRRDQIRVERAEPLEWTAIQGPHSSWIAVRIDYAQSLSSPDSDQGWRPYGDTKTTLLYYRLGELDASGRVYRYSDDQRYFNARISMLATDSNAEPSESDLRALGACLECDPNTLTAPWGDGCHWAFIMGWQGVVANRP